LSKSLPQLARKPAGCGRVIEIFSAKKKEVSG